MFKKILIGLLFSTSVFAASGSGNVSNIVGVGGFSRGAIGTQHNVEAPVAITLPTGASVGLVTTLTSISQSGSDNFYYQLYNFSDGTGLQYQVPVGKKFCVYQVIGLNFSGGVDPKWQYGTSDSTFTNNTATVPPNPIYQVGGPNLALYSLDTNPVNTGQTGAWNTPFCFGSGRYPFIHQTTGGGGLSTMLIGYESPQ